MADFIAEFSFEDEHADHDMQLNYKEEWKLFVDGASNVKGALWKIYKLIII